MGMKGPLKFTLGLARFSALTQLTRSFTFPLEFPLHLHPMFKASLYNPVLSNEAAEYAYLVGWL